MPDVEKINETQNPIAVSKTKALVQEKVMHNITEMEKELCGFSVVESSGLCALKYQIGREKFRKL